MAAPVLTEEQQNAVVSWLAAGYNLPLIEQCFLARGWTPVTRTAIHHYRDKYRGEIESRRKARLEAAFDAGLAQREARVKALVEHAATLDELKWVPDEKGKLHNEKAWRETLDDIAKEMGHRRQGVDLYQAFGKMTDAELDDYIAAAGCAQPEIGGSGAGLPPDGGAAPSDGE